eukprot:TRINITY_DN51935_c0_g1_i1.p2 TRINITY_DN51935_c0_g1~~TRINITY_DN51935_c0_g1_i1.p2  ORF type:complete len:134 (-),score=39.46 TRINITY_DN51935_c0_g1_i1:255-656(-)
MEPATSAEDALRLTVVSGGKNHIRDYVKAALEEAERGLAAGGAGAGSAGSAGGRCCCRPVILRARLKAISKAISVAEIVKRSAAERQWEVDSSSQLTGMLEQGEDRREKPEIEIRLSFRAAAPPKVAAAPTSG